MRGMTAHRPTLSGWLEKGVYSMPPFYPPRAEAIRPAPDRGVPPVDPDPGLCPGPNQRAFAPFGNLTGEFGPGTDPRAFVPLGNQTGGIRPGTTKALPALGTRFWQSCRAASRPKAMPLESVRIRVHGGIAWPVAAKNDDGANHFPSA